VRAAVRGIIDYSEARLLDPRWWKRTRLLLNAMVREDDFLLQRGIFDYHRSLASNSGLTEESFKLSQERARDSFHDILGALRPWEGSSAEERKAKEYADLRQAYVEAFGDPSDPEYQAEQEEKLRQWKEQREQEKSEYVDEWEELQSRLRAYREDIARRQKELRERRRQLGQGRW